MKHFISRILFIIITISAFFLQTCKPDDEVGKTYGPYTLGEAKDYLNFKPGSWWVYQNNKSGLYDTLVLKSISIRTKTYVGKNTIIKELINMLIYSTTSKYEYEYYSSGANPDVNSEYLKGQNFISLIHGKSKSGDYQGETVSLYYPFDSIAIVGVGLARSHYKGMDDNLIVQGKTYKEVRKFNQDNDPCWDHFTIKYYWAKDVGLIKKEKIEKGESWELINYHVEKP